MEIINLFPQPVGIRDLDRSLTAAELKCLTGQPQRPNQGNTSSQDTYVLDQKVMRGFRTWIQAQLDEYFAETITPESAVSLRITQSWTNHTDGGHWHHKHSHPNSIISGVFYVQSEPGRDRIHFYRDEVRQLKVRPSAWHMYNSESWWLESIPGRLLLFPSTLTHMVEAIPADAPTRISLSFNTFYQGIVGSDLELTQLRLK